MFDISSRWHACEERDNARSERRTGARRCSAKTAGLLPFHAGRFQRALANLSQTGFLRLVPAGMERRWREINQSHPSKNGLDDCSWIWDLSLERDEEGEAEFKARFKEQATASQHLPPQLLFVHHSQKDIKELHWHPQIPGMILSGDIDGLDILMPFNVLSTLSRRHI
ncbi:hypothetical protein KSP40_PGU022531 [Platanthera guangdongensis]|uniref:Uncharacterized protein n=1 Tax=Platanthera guangdongensis TaxID=2320717 RepID=A0ABR2MAU8_9ASPA